MFCVCLVGVGSDFFNQEKKTHFSSHFFFKKKIKIKKAVIVDNNTWNNTHIATVGRAMSLSEKKGWAIYRSLDVSYVFVVFGGFIGTDGRRRVFFSSFFFRGSRVSRAARDWEKVEEKTHSPVVSPPHLIPLSLSLSLSLSL